RQNTTRGLGKVRAAKSVAAVIIRASCHLHRSSCSTEAVMPPHDWQQESLEKIQGRMESQEHRQIEVSAAIARLEMGQSRLEQLQATLLSPPDIERLEERLRIAAEKEAASAAERAAEAKRNAASDLAEHLTSMTRWMSELEARFAENQTLLKRRIEDTVTREELAKVSKALEFSSGGVTTMAPRLEALEKARCRSRLQDAFTAFARVDRRRRRQQLRWAFRTMESAAKTAAAADARSAERVTALKFVLLRRTAKLEARALRAWRQVVLRERKKDLQRDILRRRLKTYMQCYIERHIRWGWRRWRRGCLDDADRGAAEDSDDDDGQNDGGFSARTTGRDSSAAPPPLALRLLRLDSSVADERWAATAETAPEGGDGGDIGGGDSSVGGSAMSGGGGSALLALSARSGLLDVAQKMDFLAGDTAGQVALLGRELAVLRHRE
ncbi:unnamed protein product, partial [Phaeothamnion confervicola]